MEREILIDEIFNFCFDFKLFKNPVDERQIKINIKKQLKEVEFVESLYNEIFIKAKQRKILNRTKIKELLLELEKIRIELEHTE